MQYNSSEEPQERSALQQDFALPGMGRYTYITWALLATNLGVWLLMEAVGDSENPETLLSFGAMFGPLIANGEYWRLFTAMFLHVGAMHLLVNGFVLFIFGRIVERIYGHTRFLTIYVLAGLSGSVASYTFNRIVVGAGASGAIFGILGTMAAFFVARRHSLGEMSKRNLTGVVVIAIVILGLGMLTPGIDNWAHMGGLLGGFLIGLAFAPKYELEEVIEAPPQEIRVVSLKQFWWAMPAVLSTLVLVFAPRQWLQVINGLSSSAGDAIPKIERWLAIPIIVSIMILAFPLRYRAQGSKATSSPIVKDVTSIMKRWWVVPSVSGVLILGAWLATVSASEVAQAQTLIVRADRLLDDKRIDEAFEEINKAIELNERSGAAFFVRGKVYAEMGIPNLAMADLRAAGSLGLDRGSQREAARLLLELRSQGP